MLPLISIFLQTASIFWFTIFTAKMTSLLIQTPLQAVATSKPSTIQIPSSSLLHSSSTIQKPSSSLLHSIKQQKQNSLQKLISIEPERARFKSRTSYLSLKCTLQSSKPPTTKEEAILQAKTSLWSSLSKPLNNPKLAGKLKKLKQPRFRVEIPIIDDSPSSLSQLAVEVFGDMPTRRKGSKIKIVMLWPGPGLARAALEAFGSRSSDNVVQNIDVSSVLDEDVRTMSSADFVVFLAPEASQIDVIKTVSDGLYPRPVVIFNPRWSFEDEEDFGEMTDFVGSFEVVYSFFVLEVRGILSKRKGMIFKYVNDGVLSGEKWNVLIEEEGEMRVVSSFKTRPSITKVENVLYNLMAMNSPITKSAKFLKDLVSNVTGKK